MYDSSPRVIPVDGCMQMLATANGLSSVECGRHGCGRTGSGGLREVSGIDDHDDGMAEAPMTLSDSAYASAQDSGKPHDEVEVGGHCESAVLALSSATSGRRHWRWRSSSSRL